MAVTAVTAGLVGSAASILKNVLIWGGGLLVLIIILHAVSESIKEKSLRPIVTEVGQKLFASENYLYSKMQNLQENPSITNSKLNEFDSTKGRMTWELKRIWFYIDSFLSLAFLFGFGYVIYRLVGLFGDWNVVGNVTLTLIIVVLIELVFTAIMYDPAAYDNKSFMQLEWDTQVKLLNPLKGVTSVIVHYDYFLGKAYNIVEKVNEAQDSENPIISTVTRTLT
jgi:hypothetical protein|tara:strand:- start:2788 stop:3459 length:672 start_codon:yes stop_codon:yes gene_type:complete